MKFRKSVLIPASVVADSPDLAHMTFKIGLIGRALAIFRVSRVCIYLDDDPYVRNQVRERELVKLLLSYMETPQYLRKLLFPKRKELACAGMLQPLRTPHHPSQDEKNTEGSFREGAVIETSGGKSILDIGLQQKGFFSGVLKRGERVTVRLGKPKGRDLIEVVPVKPDETGEYWGYEVTTADGLKEGLEKLDGDVNIGTSRYGRNLYEGIRGIKEGRKSVTIAFGGPYAGLQEICRRQGIKASEVFDVMINAVPGQGTRTVRTEEAIIITLGIVNALTGE
ncbi:MAG: RNA methyltransferase [Candidatus Hadarchaeales archaeon]